ncbi:MAG: hypothetical protein KAR21_10755 [Spirochaetales bacterium]|nr:hypothetical protein [Spirochaetales bacterium]
MKRDSILPVSRNPGFIKTVRPGKTKIKSSDRIALIRKGNELFNSGNHETAKRIFMTTGYSDGLIRMGDYYMKKNNPVDALKMYWMAPAPAQFEQISEQTAAVISKWLKEEEKVNE